MATLKDLGENYLQVYAPSVNLKSIIVSRSNINGFYKFFGKNRKWNSLKVKDIVGYVNHRKDMGIKNGTIRRELAVLQSIISQGLKFEVIDCYEDGGDYSKDYRLAKRIIKNITSCMPRKEVRRVRPTFEEVEKINKELPEYLFRVAHAACMLAYRKSELLGLKFKHLNLEEKEIYLEGSKNGDSRITPLFPEAYNFFKKIKEEAIKDFGNDIDDLYIFRNKFGRKVCYWSLYEPFKKAQIKLRFVNEDGKPKYHFHDYRKLAVRWLIEKKGFSTAMVKDAYSGHRSDEIFEDIYNIRGADTYQYYKKIALKS